jgi:hypothetical protein
MKKSQKIILLIIIVFVTAVSIFLLNTKSESISVPAPELMEQTKTDAQPTTKGFIYENQEFGFSFTYPEGWRLGDNNLGRGTLQLFNYQEQAENGSTFSKGLNKIEAVVIENDSYESSDDYPEERQEKTEVIIAGKKVTRVVTELNGGERTLSYLIPLIETDSKSLLITIYGDPANFNVLDNVILTFEWVK